MFEFSEIKQNNNSQEVEMEQLQVVDKLDLQPCKEHQNGVSFVILENETAYIFKPKQEEVGLGKNSQEKKDLYKRERAAFVVDKYLDFQLVPTTVIREIDSQVGSLQVFVKGVLGMEYEDLRDEFNPNYQSDLEPIDMLQLNKLWVFDLLTNNIDRHLNNFIVQQAKVWAIDNGSSFFYDQVPSGPIEYWDEPLPEEIISKLRSLISSEQKMVELETELKDLLGEVTAKSFMKSVVKSTPKDVFLHLFNIVTFYLSVIGLITLCIQYINALLPDALNYNFTSIANAVRWSSSILFVAVPAYIFTAWLLAKDLAKTPEKRELTLRKWLVYFTLFISAITIIIDLMIFVYNFLDGELTTKFFLKVFVVLLVAGAVFGFYLWDLKRKNIKSKVPRILAIIVSVVILLTIIAGFFIVGTPFEQRARRMDEQRVRDLQIIQNQIVDYWTRKEALPEKIDVLQDNISGFVLPTDPKTQMPYEYNLLEPLKFELCSDFATSSKDFSTNRKESMAPTPFGSYQQNWDHEVGRTCFSRDIDPDLYKGNENNPKVLR